MSSNPRFSHTVKREPTRIMIESTCSGCGETQLVSYGDGSLARWEQEHQCNADEDSLRKAPAS